MMTIKVELTEAEVKKAIAHYLNDHPHWVKGQPIFDDDVKIDVGVRYEDRGQGSYPVFNKAVVTIKQAADPDNGTSPDDKG